MKLKIPHKPDELQFLAFLQEYIAKRYTKTVNRPSEVLFDKLPPEEFYKTLAEDGLFYMTAFRALTHVYRGEIVMIHIKILHEKPPVIKRDAVLNEAVNYEFNISFIIDDGE